jgi:hypothetical protein
MKEPDPSIPTRLVVLAAFDKGEDGELHPAFEAREMPDEDRAKRAARMLAGQHAGIIAWSRTADLVNGLFGEPEVLAVYGEVPDME